MLQLKKVKGGPRIILTHNLYMIMPINDSTNVMALALSDQLLRIDNSVVEYLY